MIRWRNRVNVFWAVLLLICTGVGGWLIIVSSSKEREVLSPAPHRQEMANSAFLTTVAAKEQPLRAPVESTLSAEPYYLSWGETISGLLLRQGVAPSFAFDIVDRLSDSEVDVRQWRTSDPIILLHNSTGVLNGMTFPMLTAQVRVSWQNGDIELTHHYPSLRRRAVARSVTIQNSLYADGEAAGIDSGVLMELLGIYSFDVDLQRDLQPGNRFEVLYYVLENEREQILRYDDILYTSLEIGDGRVYSYFLFDGSAKHRGYYSSDGRSVRKALMKTPIDGAHISSSYGYRNNPTRRGYSDYHTGIDFAAPRGTPIYAAGNGRILVRGWSRVGYGRYIVIEHPNNYRTLYAHMSAFRSGLAVGSHVTQGEIIGYVGSSGNSTGSHLHYEVYYHRSTINPLSLKSPPTTQLVGDELSLFHRSINAKLASLGNALILADHQPLLTTAMVK